MDTALGGFGHYWNKKFCSSKLYGMIWITLWPIVPRLQIVFSHLLQHFLLVRDKWNYHGSLINTFKAFVIIYFPAGLSLVKFIKCLLSPSFCSHCIICFHNSSLIQRNESVVDISFHVIMYMQQHLFLQAISIYFCRFNHEIATA